MHPALELLDAANALADRIAKQDPLAVRISKQVFSMPREAHPQVDNLAQAILFESEAKFERMQAFLDRRDRKAAEKAGPSAEQQATTPAEQPATTPGENP